jgi:Na+/H+ antiporter NhaD/arsenite permease-like protein
MGRILVLAAALISAPGSAFAAAGPDGAALSWLWAVPFAGLLLSIAILPLAAPALWHHHYGKIALGWALAVVAPYAALFGAGTALVVFWHAMAAEYVPFLILIGALFTIAGGVYVKGNLHGSPKTNTALLAVGTGIASVTGTTGAAMLLIRPVLRANDERVHNAHVVIFFIFLVANIGGSLTPLGDPPLFLGFLKGVDFFWPTVHLIWPMLLVTGILLAVFYALDSWFYHRDEAFKARFDPTPDAPLAIEGKVNIALLGCVVLAVLMSGVWKPGISWDVLGTEIELQGVARDLLLIGLAVSSPAARPTPSPGARFWRWRNSSSAFSSPSCRSSPCCAPGARARSRAWWRWSRAPTARPTRRCISG